MKNRCSCGSELFYISKVGNQYGLYCSVCGAWNKWANKDEVRLYSPVNNDVESVEIKIKYFKDIPKLKKNNTGDWIDLYVSEDTFLQQFSRTLLPLGVAIELPREYEGLIIPRSTTFRRYGLIQPYSVVTIDEIYKGDNGEWHLPVYNLGGSKRILKGTWLCQFRLFKHQPECKFIEITTLGGADV